MKVDHVFNNNIVRVLDNGAETILTGLGIGFQVRAGDTVDLSRVEKRFVLEAGTSSTTVNALVSDLPYDMLQLASSLAVIAERDLGVEMSPIVHFALADHLTAAIERARQNKRLDNPLLWEIRSTYGAEFDVALDMAKIATQVTGVPLPLDEVGYLAMHLVNASLTGNMRATIRSVDVVQQIITVVRDRVGIAVAQSSNEYLRFVTHIKYFVQRLEDGTPFHNSDSAMFDLLRSRDELIYDCAIAVADFATSRYDVPIPSEEVMYLMLHIHRIRYPDLSE